MTSFLSSLVFAAVGMLLVSQFVPRFGRITARIFGGIGRALVRAEELELEHTRRMEAAYAAYRAAGEPPAKKLDLSYQSQGRMRLGTIEVGD
jgi:hypothetical protein